MSEIKSITSSHLRELSRQEFWQEHVSQWQRGTLSQSDYCREHDLIYHQFGYWKRLLCGVQDSGDKVISNPGSSAFVPVSIAAPDTRSTELSVLMPSGVRIEGISDSSINIALNLVRQL